MSAKYVMIYLFSQSYVKVHVNNSIVANVHQTGNLIKIVVLGNVVIHGNLLCHKEKSVNIIVHMILIVS